ncbi:MAG: SLC13 family permease [bacterium]|nr:SLC13 family permease [bacterium]
MTFEIGFLFAVLAAMVYLFLTEKLPVDLTAFLGLVVLIFGGYLTPSEAFTGFSSSAVITMLSVFIVGAALLATGVADLIGAHIHKIVGSSETRLIVVLMVVAGVLSAFMNNIAATAVLMPAVATIGPRAGLAPGRLFMPLAFGAILGGTTTLVGTPPNILAAQILEERGLEPFGLFDFTPLGLAILALGTVFMLTIGRRLLPAGEQHGPAMRAGDDLSQVYQLQDRRFTMRIPDGSPLHGRTLAETRLGNTLGVKVVAILHAGRKQMAADGDTMLRSGDVLLVDGQAEDVGEMLRLQGVEVAAVASSELPATQHGVGGIRMRIATGSSLAGHGLRELRFRDRFGVVVMGIHRGDEVLRDRLADAVLEEGDVVLALGRRDELEELSSETDFEVEDVGVSALHELQDELSWIRVPGGSQLADTTIKDSRLGELVGLTVVGVVRGDETRLAVPAEETIRAGDRLLVAADPQRLVSFLELGEVELDESVDEAFESEEAGMVEVAMAPRSAAAGKTLIELDFQKRFGLLALALWREGRAVHGGLGRIALRFGDALLLQGPREKIKKLATETDFVVLSQADQAARRTHKAPAAIGCLLLMIGIVASGWQPIHVAAFAAASLVVLFGAMTMQEAYRAIEWRAIFLVAAVLPAGLAMERTGAAQLLADSVTSVAGPYGPYAILGALIVLASMLSQGLDGAPAVVLLAPVVLQAAETLKLSPYPLMMGVSLAASAAFMTPFSHKANLLVMGAGGYRSSDYLRVGTPLTLMLFVLLILLVPVFFPFYP